MGKLYAIVPLGILAALLTCGAASADLDPLSDYSELGIEPAISPTRLEQSVLTVPVSVTIFTAEDLRLRGHLTLHDVFRDIPGFRVSLIGTEKRLSYHGTAVRQNRRLRVTVDGVNLLIGDGAYVEFNRLPFTIEAISRIVVTRGTNGASFGDNAFLASIDFELKDGLEQGTSITAGVGHSDRKSLSGSHTSRYKNVDLSIVANAYRIREHKYRGDPPAENGSEERTNRVVASAVINPERNNSITIRASAYDSYHDVEWDIGSNIGHQDNSGWSFSVAQQNDLSVNERLDWSFSLNAQEEILTQFACFDESLQTLVDAIAPESSARASSVANALSIILARPLSDICGRSDIGIESHRGDLELEYNFVADKLSYALGSSLSHAYATSPQYFKGDEELLSARIFGELSIESEPWTLNLGVMGQYASNIEKLYTAARTSLSWSFSPTQSLRVQASQSFRFPSLVESHANWALQFSLIDVDIALPDGYLESQTGRSLDDESRPDAEWIRSFELAYVIADRSRGIAFDGKLFYESITDPIRYSNFFFTDLPANDHDYEQHGGEIDFRYRVNSSIDLRLVYSYLRSNAITDFERGLYGRHAGSIFASYRFSSTQHASLGYYANSKIGGLSYGRTDLAYGRDFSLGKQFLSLKLVAQHFDQARQGNLLDGINNPRVVQLGVTNQLFASLEYRW